MTTRLERRLKAEGITLQAYTQARAIYERVGLTLSIGYRSGRFHGWKIEGFVSGSGILWLSHWVPLTHAIAEPQQCIAEWRAQAKIELAFR